MTPTATLPVERRLEREGVVFASPSELQAFFDSQSRALVGIPGEKAIERIKTGAIGNDPAWSELIQLFLLL